MAPVSSCRNDGDCDDGVYCNGQERCLHVGATNALTGANARGCAAASNTPLRRNGPRVLRESSGGCAVFPVDADGDGHASIATGGDCGTDIDDTRLRTSPRIAGVRRRECVLGRHRTCQLSDGDGVHPSAETSRGVCAAAPPGYVAPPRYTGPIQPPLTVKIPKTAPRPEPHRVDRPPVFSPPPRK